MLPPTYASPQLRDYVQRRIVFPMRHPERFHPITGTLPWVHSIYGCEGLGKARIMQELLHEHGLLNHRVVSVEVGGCGAALRVIACIRKAVLAAAGREDEEEGEEEGETAGGKAVAFPPTYVLIIDHADILVNEPDSEATMLGAISIPARMQAAGIMTVALFDQTPGQMAIDRSNAFMRACHSKFFAQYGRSVCYAAVPSSEFRERLFRWAVGVFCAHMETSGNNAARPFKCMLDDNDYVQLATMSTFTTPAQILEWLNRSFREIIENPAYPLLDMDFLTRWGNVYTGGRRGPQIVKEDMEVVESNFSEACGGGPVGSYSQALPPAAAMREAEVKITTFSEENASAAAAKSSLAAIGRKGKQPKRGRKKSKKAAEASPEEDRDEFQ